MPSHVFEDPAFTIRLFPSRKLLEIDYRGSWDGTTLSRYEQELRRMLSVLQRSGCPYGEHVTILDMTAFPVQSQEMVEGLGAIVADPVFRSRRIAVVLSSALAKMQVKRKAPDYRIFDNHDEAMAWLGEGDS